MAAISPQTSSSISQSEEAEESLDDADEISRLVFASRIPPGVGDFILQSFFDFPSDKRNPETDRVESVIWRKIIPANDAIHAIGNAMAAGARDNGKDREYRGFRTSTIGTVKAKQTTNGHKFSIHPYPKEGKGHLHIQVIVNKDGPPYGPADKSDVRALDGTSVRSTRSE